LERISDLHLKEVREYLTQQLETIDELKVKVAERYSWREFPEPMEGRVYAVDGTRMMKRLSGAIIYAVSSVAIGDDLFQWHEIGLVSPYKHVDERVRIHMEILEKRIGAMAAEMGAELVLMDGTLSGSIIRPPAYVNSTTKELYQRHGDRLLNLIEEFLELLNGKWEEWRATLRKEGVLNFPTLLSRGTGGRDVFEILGEEEESWEDDREDVTILLEYIEYLHALDRLMGGRVASIAKTFYRDDIIKTVRGGKRGPAMLDVPVIDSLWNEPGYLPFAHTTQKKRGLPTLVEELMLRGHFRNLASLLMPTYENGRKHYIERIKPFYIRFVRGGVIYLLEIPETQNAERTISQILSVAEDEYVVPLEYAHHSVVIKKKEFDAYVDALLSALVGDDGRFLSFLRYGREPLE